MAAEIVNWEDLVEAGGYAGARERAKLRIEGRDYVMQRRRRDDRALHAVAAVLALAALALFPAAAEAVGPETVIQDDAALLYHSDAEVRASVERIQELGIDRVRITAAWGLIAPAAQSRERPRFDAGDSSAYGTDGWARIDRVLRELRRAGLRPMIDLAFHAPRWAAGGQRTSKNYRDRPSVLEYRRFVAAAARRYRGDFPDPANPGEHLPAVRLWTTWNEPNHPTFLLPQWRRARGGGWRPAAPHLYRRLHEAAYTVLKRSSRSNRVLIGGLAAVGRLAGDARTDRSAAVRARAGVRGSPPSQAAGAGVPRIQAAAGGRLLPPPVFDRRTAGACVAAPR